MAHCNGLSSWLRMASAAAIGSLVALPALADAPPPAGPDPWETAQSVSEAGSEGRAIGRAVAVRGQVYARTPGGERRLLREGSPIFPGDELITDRGAQLGVLSGEYYTGLDSDTVLTYRKLGNGAPEVSLARGDVRLVNAGEGPNARIETPGLQVASAGADTSAYALQEKAWIVSMVCALEGQVHVVSAEGGQTLLVEEGGCAASKPLEGLYLAGAAGAPLPLLAPVGAGAAAAGTLAAAAAGAAGADAAAAAAAAGAGADAAAAAAAAGDEAGAAGGAGAGGGAMPLAGRAASRFAGPDVAAFAGLGLGAFGARPGLAGVDNSLTILEPCDSPASGCAASFAVLPTPPPQQPTNPWVPGTQPP